MYWANPGVTVRNGFLAGAGLACLSDWVVALAGIVFENNLAGVMTNRSKQMDVGPKTRKSGNLGSFGLRKLS